MKRKNINSLIRLLLFVALLTGILHPAYSEPAPVAEMNKYYVDALRGSDLSNGGMKTPFRSIQRAADAMSPGDVCIIRKGIYRETVTPHKNQLTFENYPGEYVLITGLDVFTGWQRNSGPVQTRHTPIKVTQMFVDGKRINIARYPNEDGDMFSKGDLETVDIPTEQPTGKVEFLNAKPFPKNAFVGGYFVGHSKDSNWWTAMRGKIVSSEGNTLNCTDLTAAWRNPKFGFGGEGYGCIIGSLDALDSDNEWLWQNDILYLQLPKNISSKDAIIEGRTRIHGFDLTGSNHITLEGLHFKAADLHLPDSNDCLIKNCTVRYGGFFPTFFLGGTSQREAWGDYENGASAIYIGGSHNQIIDCYIGRTWTHGVSLWGEFNSIENSIIEQVDWIGERMQAVWCPGDDNRILHNTIRDTGREGIELGNSNFGINKYAMRARIQFNHLYNISYFCTDSGFLYTNHQGGRRTPANTEISYNVMHDFMKKSGNPHGGIYLDNGSSGYSIHHNIIWNSTDGIMVRDQGDASNRVNEVYIYNNTLVNVKIPVKYQDKKHPIPNSTSTVIAKNNLSDSTEFGGSETSHNLTVDPSSFVDFENHDYSLKASSPAVDAGVDIENITGNAKGKPDVGALEYGTAMWKVGADIQIPEFIDETRGLASLPDNQGSDRYGNSSVAD